eukprot:SAG31_NODE_3316_length_4425_cov_3.196024_8_plen_348_part_00
MDKLALGCVQLGIPYGAANQSGMPSSQDAVEIIRLACESCIPYLDTAHIYGESEKRIGDALAALGRLEVGSRPSIVTKIGAAELLDPGLTPDAAAAIGHVERIFQTSKDRLKISTLDTVLLHSYDCYQKLLDGVAYDRLVQLQKLGDVRRIGVSAYTPEEVLTLLADPLVQHIQLPFNLLDFRWKSPRFSAAVAARPDMTIHTRSTFLQGVLVAGVDRWAPFAQEHVAPVIIDALENLVAILGRRDRVDLCTAYSRGMPWITQVLTGAETAAQLEDTIALFRTTQPLTRSEIAQVDAALQALGEDVVTDRLLNPGQWIRQEEIPQGYDTAQGMYRGPGSLLTSLSKL